MPRRLRDDPRYIRSLDLRDAEWEPVFKLAREVYPGRAINVVIQELIRIGLSHDPFQPAVATARQAAYAAASAQVRIAMAQALRSISDGLMAGKDLAATDVGLTSAHHTGEYFEP